MFYHQGEIGILRYSWYSNAQHFIKKWDNEWSNGGINCLFMLKRRQLPEPLFNLNTQYLRVGAGYTGCPKKRFLRRCVVC